MKMSASNTVFDNLPDDYFKFIKNGRPDAGKLVKVLKFTKRDVSDATGIPIGSIRYDKRLPEELERGLFEWATALNLVAEYFGDKDKTITWFMVKNPLLGNLSPQDMIRLGRFQKLRTFILNARTKNTR